MSATGLPLLILTHFGPPAEELQPLIAAGRVRAIRQIDLREADLHEAPGLITTIHLDQNDFAARRPALEAFIARGGRLVFNGHPVRPMIDGLDRYHPLTLRRRSDLDLVRLSGHPVFEGMAAASLVTRKGVAGFYGRGHVPLPEGAQAITGIGPDRLPIDWEWRRPSGGRIFVHAGNDLWTVADSEDSNRQLAERLVDWCAERRPGKTET